MATSLRTSVSDGIYFTLRSQILDLKFEPGQELNVIDLTQQMQVSRSPVRDALMRLAADRLVDIFPQKGTRVSLLDMKQVEEERFIRTSLEERAVRQFVMGWTQSDIVAMEAAIAQQRIATQSGSFEQFIQWDDAFHSVMFQSMGHGRSWELIESQCGNYHRIRLLSFRYEGVSEEVVSQHEQMVQAIIHKDLDKVLDLERHHVSKLLEESRWMLEKYPDFFVHESHLGEILRSVL